MEQVSNAGQQVDNGISPGDVFTSMPCGIPTILSPLASPTWPTFNAEDLARRNSLSLLNRTPPRGSLAAELLGPHTSPVSASNHSALSNIRDIMESLSDFNSCLSSTTDDSENENQAIPKDAFRKRKRKKTTNKAECVKKVDLKVSPDKPL